MVRVTTKLFLYNFGFARAYKIIIDRSSNDSMKRSRQIYTSEIRIKDIYLPFSRSKQSIEAKSVQKKCIEYC